jgi:hypothetical protein
MIRIWYAAECVSTFVEYRCTRLCFFDGDKTTDNMIPIIGEYMHHGNGHGGLKVPHTEELWDKLLWAAGLQRIPEKSDV